VAQGDFGFALSTPITLYVEKYHFSIISIDSFSATFGGKEVTLKSQ